MTNENHPESPRTTPLAKTEGAAEAATTAVEAEDKPKEPEGPSYEYGIGDKLYIPGHHGDYVGVVVHRYPNLQEACDRYERSFMTILKQPHGKVKGDQPFYFCEVANKTRDPIAVAESSARLKWRNPENDEN